MALTNDWDRIADLYDSYIRVGFDVPFLVEEARSRPGQSVLELMAGTGRISVPLVEAGVQLTAHDGSAPMLSRLRTKLEAKGLTADLHLADVRALELGRRFDLVLLPFQSLSELLDRSDRQAVLARAARHLAPGGRFVCTLHNPTVRFRAVDGPSSLPPYGASPRVLGPFPLEGGGTLVFQLAQMLDAATGVATMVQLFEVYGDDGRLREKRLMTVRFANIPRGEFEADATAAGLQVEALFGNYDRSPFDEASSPFLIYRLRMEGAGA